MTSIISLLYHIQQFALGYIWNAQIEAISYNVDILDTQEIQELVKDIHENYLDELDQNDDEYIINGIMKFIEMSC